MKKVQVFGAAAGLLLILAFPLSAQVDEAELSGNQAAVEFINYEGPHARIETNEQIRNIGYSLGVMIRNGQDRAGSASRYFVIHSQSAGGGNKLDADIFGLGVDAGVDHIRNLRLIIQGYLEAAYDYSARDAALLAQYVTIYNAVYRGDWNYFSGRYKDAVMQNMVKEKAGLSIRYDEWPGQTLALIPLGTGAAGSLSAVNTTAVTEPAVTEQLRQQDDKAVEQRKDMVDLKEREADQARDNAAAQRQQAAEGQKQVDQQKQEIAQTQQNINAEKQNIAQEQQANEQEKQNIAQERQNPQADQAALDQRQQAAEAKDDELAQRQEQVQQQQQQVDQKQEEVAQKQEEVNQQQQQAAQNENLAEQKQQEARKEREDIADDQQKVIDQTPAAPPASAQPAGILGAEMLSDSAPLGRLVKLNPADGSTLKTSPMTTVNIRTVNAGGNTIVAVAGANTGSGAIRLVQVDNTSLEMTKQGDDDISPQSLLWVNGKDLYAITVVNGQNYLARFNADLQKQAATASPVHPYAAVVFSGGQLITQRANGSVMMLDPQTLAEK